MVRPRVSKTYSSPPPVSSYYSAVPPPPQGRTVARPINGIAFERKVVSRLKRPVSFPDSARLAFVPSIKAEEELKSPCPPPSRRPLRSWSPPRLKCVAASGGGFAPSCVWCSSGCLGGLFVLLAWGVFRSLVVFVVVSRSFSFASFGLSFGLSVRGGVWCFVSCRSGRVLSGGAVSVCRSALLRRGLLGFALLLGSPVCRAVVRGFGVSSSPRGFASFVRSLRRPAPLALPAPSAPSAPSVSSSGSALFLLSPAFLSAVASGRCPVSLCLSVFRWPVRSAVLLSLLRVSCAPAVLRALPRSLLLSFVRVGLASLGFRGVFRPSAPLPALRFLGGCPVASVPSFSGVCRASSVGAGFASVGRCLSWLLRSGRGCPGACRPALAGLLLVLVRFLAC